MIQSLLLLAAFHAPGCEAHWYLDKAFAKEQHKRPASVEVSQRIFRHMTEVSCGLSVDSKDLIILLDLPQETGITAIENPGVEILCKVPDEYTDQTTETYFLVVRGGEVPETLSLRCRRAGEDLEITLRQK